jgi:glycerol kinase
VVWDPATGRPWYNAIVWQDTRTAPVLPGLEPHRVELRDRTGLPPSTYFSAAKLAWVLDHVPGVRSAAENGRAVFGTIDSWLVWHLTGGAGAGRHVTDVTNACRTQLVNLRTLDWDDALLTLFRIPRAMLPAIASPALASASASRSPFGMTTRTGPLGAEVPIAAVLGDQHAALIGQTCFDAGDVKNTYGTGNFLLLNTGAQIVPSAAGLLTTVGYTLGNAAAVYALEGSVAVTGSAVQWLRDQLGVIAAAAEIEPLAASVPDSAGVYFVPAFSGLFAPYWRPDARGIITGLARFHTKAHLARATLEAICFQSRAVIDAMSADAGVRPPLLKVDGGATRNGVLMQLQADILGIPVVRPIVNEITALGAAYAAGLAAGVWPSVAVLRAQWRADRIWEPTWTADRRDAAFHHWNKAVSLAIDVETASGDGSVPTTEPAPLPSPLP